MDDFGEPVFTGDPNAGLQEELPDLLETARTRLIDLLSESGNPEARGLLFQGPVNQIFLVQGGYPGMFTNQKPGSRYKVSVTNTFSPQEAQEILGRCRAQARLEDCLGGEVLAIQEDNEFPYFVNAVYVTSTSRIELGV